MPNMYTLVAPCFFGTEHTLSFEVKRLGAQNVKVTDGRVAFEGDAAMIAAANLNLRTAERVLLLLKTFPAATFDELFDGVYSIPWEELIPVDAQFPVKGSSLSSQLSSVPACQSIVKKAIVKRLQYGHKTTTLPETGALYKIRFALRKNVVEVMLDTSGDGLHKRGYRKNATLAPIKETLAATIADVGFVRRDSTVQDPFCGSGTLVIEAAQKALNIAPGLRRRFAAEQEAQLQVEYARRRAAQSADRLEKPRRAKPAAAGSLSEADEKLLNALYAVRKRLAGKQNLPAFMVFNDATLREMAEKKPMSIDELLNISGVGEKKAARYGNAFLRVIEDAVGSRE